MTRAVTHEDGISSATFTAVDAPRIFQLVLLPCKEVGCHDAIREGSVANRQRPTEYACHMGQINDRCPFCLVCERAVHWLAALPGADTTVIPRPVPV